MLKPPTQLSTTQAASIHFDTDPNPRVGCVLTSADGGEVLGQGRTQPAGQAHAEVMALRAAREAGRNLQGATAWVTLEPCAHHGRTPPCCDALIAAGLARVVVALRDPNPLVAGQGIARMRAAGLEVQVAGAFEGAFAAGFAAAHPSDPQGLAWAREAFELNIGFFSRMARGRPWVRMKVAASLDGQTALADGRSQWITAPQARADGHAWRRRAGAVLTGIGTVRDDDPRLDVRLDLPAGTPLRQPMRVVVDSRLEVDPGARVLQPPGQVLVACAAAHADSARARALTRRAVRGGDTAAAPGRLEVAGAWEGVEVVGLPADAQGKTDLKALLELLAARGVNELHVEAGHRLHGSLLAAGLVDEMLVYLAPTLLGPGRGMATLAPLASLADAPALSFIDCVPIGQDVRLRARPRGRADFLSP